MPVHLETMDSFVHLLGLFNMVYLEHWQVPTQNSNMQGQRPCVDDIGLLGMFYYECITTVSG
jgi:hypothetical protein